MDSLYIDRFDFKIYSFEHYFFLILSVVLGIYMLYKARGKWNEDQQVKYATWLALACLITQVAKPIIRLQLGNFDIKNDLPLHLCNIMPLCMIFVMAKKNRFFFGVFFFWIVCGTSQSLFTPSLTENFPHYESIRYWTVHTGLTILAIYGLVVYRWKLGWKDVFYSWIGLNISAGIIHLVNLKLDSNYWYTVAKPLGKTMYDLLGPWPTYMFQLEYVSVLLFGTLLLIIMGIEKIMTRGYRPIHEAKSNDLSKAITK
jgi:hypothetical integral membrane protein (TIGR02206 family)